MSGATDLPFRDEHEMFRRTARRFFETECAPHHGDWEAAGEVPRDIWRRAGELGLLCPTIPSEYGGGGGDILFSVVLMEEQVRAGVVAPMLSLHNDVVAPYVLHYGTDAQKHRLLPRMADGSMIGAIGMTEPGAGSDLQSMRCFARRDGDDYVIRGQKTFISHGHLADLIVLAAKTGTDSAAAKISLFLFETAGAAGFRRGRHLEKLGQHSADTAELFFDDVRVPAAALLGGEEGRGFAQLMSRLVEERLMTAVAAVAYIDRALELTVDYVKQREAFGQRVFDFQNTRFKLAEAKTEAVILRAFLNRCLNDFVAGQLDAATAAMLKWWSTEQQCAIVDDCVQLHGGYGYILDYPIARMWQDVRIAKIYGGSNEIMKEIIARSL
ncbi:MAG TPA: acyl-CoA dehydrogenase family protein [Pseudomonadales bacterium]